MFNYQEDADETPAVARQNARRLESMSTWRTVHMQDGAERNAALAAIPPPVLPEFEGMLHRALSYVAECGFRPAGRARARVMISARMARLTEPALMRATEALPHDAWTLAVRLAAARPAVFRRWILSCVTRDRPAFERVRVGGDDADEDTPGAALVRAEVAALLRA
jgi:hypothetical protein